jgi:hypothetical protein
MHLLSHDDSANRPLSKPDDKANTIVFTFLWLMGYYIVMSQRQSLHVSSFVSACRSVMHHFSASRYMALHAPLQRKSLHGPPQRQSLHVDSIHCQRLL